ncbi:MAG: HAD family hydrolase [Spirochaetia bacterium]|nr:HAD family hydrolase [Spirochaetia bacterium]
MNVFFKNIDWQNIEYVGFDMDGTLYDEIDFISQVYSKICSFLNEGAFDFMLNRWLEKGSSYSKIFEEAYANFNINLSISKNDFIKESLNIFRSFEPTLKLTTRVVYFLELYKKEYKLFLVTDGNPDLQRRKFETLDLFRYFENKYVVFTGKYGIDYEKPSTKAIDLLKIEPARTVFFGDRKKDEIFALSSGMQFQKVYNMIVI